MSAYISTAIYQFIIQATGKRLSSRKSNAQSDMGTMSMRHTNQLSFKVTWQFWMFPVITNLPKINSFQIHSLLPQPPPIFLWNHPVKSESVSLDAVNSQAEWPRETSCAVAWTPRPPLCFASLSDNLYSPGKTFCPQAHIPVLTLRIQTVCVQIYHRHTKLPAI
jgi:hypothetical protein